MKCRGNDTLSEQFPRARQVFLLRFLVSIIPGSLDQQADGNRAVKHILTSCHTNYFMQEREDMLSVDTLYALQVGSIFPRFYQS